MAVWEKFEASGAVQFNAGAHTTIEDYLAPLTQMAALRGLDVETEVEDWRHRYRDYLLLSGIEVAVALEIASGNALTQAAEAVRVDSAATRLALAKVDCGWFSVHTIRKAAPDVRLWDVILFAGDMTKLETLGLTDPTRLYDEAADVIERLAEGYEETRQHLTQSPINLEHLPLLAAAWVGKYGIMAGDDKVDDRVSALLLRGTAQDRGTTLLAR